MLDSRFVDVADHEDEGITFTVFCGDTDHVADLERNRQRPPSTQALRLRLPLT